MGCVGTESLACLPPRQLLHEALPPLKVLWFPLRGTANRLLLYVVFRAGSFRHLRSHNEAVW